MSAASLEAYAEAAARGSDLVVFPELAIAGYPPEDLLLKPGFLVESRKALDAFAAKVGDTVAVIGFVDCDDPEHGKGPVYNAAAVIADGRIRCVYRKMFLPNYGVFDEKRYFTPGTEPQFFTLNGAGIGISICEDVWVNHSPHCHVCSTRHMDILLNLSASPFHAGKVHERTVMLSERSRECGSAVVYANLVGGQDELVFDGGSMVFGADGEKLAAGPLFREELMTCDIEVAATPLTEDVICEELASKPVVRDMITSFAPPSLSVDEEVLEALVLGTRDYIRKNGFSKVVIGLSGGIDSALVAAVAVRALGPDNVIGVTMPSKYTSTGTRSDAEVLAVNLGIRFMELPIRSVYDAFEAELTGVFEGIAPDVTEENIQARIRGTLLMALVEQVRLDGAHHRQQERDRNRLLHPLWRHGGRIRGYQGCAQDDGLPNLPSHQHTGRSGDNSESIIIRPPSAELRPDQKDEDSLPPYEVLDPILAEYIERDLA